MFFLWKDVTPQPIYIVQCCVQMPIWQYTIYVCIQLNMHHFTFILACDLHDICISGSVSGSIRTSRMDRVPYLSGLECTGNEENLLDCQHIVLSSTSCQQQAIAGVICQG